MSFRNGTIGAIKKMSQMCMSKVSKVSKSVRHRVSPIERLHEYKKKYSFEEIKPKSNSDIYQSYSNGTSMKDFADRRQLYGPICTSQKIYTQQTRKGHNWTPDNYHSTSSLEDEILSDDKEGMTMATTTGIPSEHASGCTPCTVTICSDVDQKEDITKILALLEKLNKGTTGGEYCVQISVVPKDHTSHNIPVVRDFADSNFKTNEGAHHCLSYYLKSISTKLFNLIGSIKHFNTFNFTSCTKRSIEDILSPELLSKIRNIINNPLTKKTAEIIIVVVISKTLSLVVGSGVNFLIFSNGDNTNLPSDSVETIFINACVTLYRASLSKDGKKNLDIDKITAFVLEMAKKTGIQLSVQVIVHLVKKTIETMKNGESKNQEKDDGDKRENNVSEESSSDLYDEFINSHEI